ncbi:hypothetical protein EDB84DRAFT_1438957 [Lactarius hengduanensis]|nr:hypothetical protein EDB84DRAFT_1438957 [Lactarius hengduanensis]
MATLTRTRVTRTRDPYGFCRPVVIPSLDPDSVAAVGCQSPSLTAVKARNVAYMMTRGPRFQPLPLIMVTPPHWFSDIPTSSHFPNTDDGFLPTRVSDSRNAVTNEPIADLVSDVGEDWFPPAGWMCAPPNTARSLDVDRYSTSSSHTTLTLYDSQNITSDVLDMSGNAHSFNPQLHSTRSPNHPSTSPRSPGNFSDLLTWDSSYLGQEPEAASAELSPAIWFSIEASPVLPAVAGKEKRCALCGIRFTQSQVLNRHMKDKHEDKGSCPHCLNFRWSRGRPYLYTRHLQAKHSGLASLEGPPGGTRMAQVLRARARQCKVSNREVTFRGLVPNQCWLPLSLT